MSIPRQRIPTVILQESSVLSNIGFLQIANHTFKKYKSAIWNEFFDECELDNVEWAEQEYMLQSVENHCFYSGE